MNSGYFTIRKGDGIKARRLMRVLVEPETDDVLWLYRCGILDAPIRANAAVFASVRISDSPVHPLICYDRRLKLVAARPALLNHIAGRDARTPTMSSPIGGKSS